MFAEPISAAEENFDFSGHLGLFSFMLKKNCPWECGLESLEGTQNHISIGNLETRSRCQLIALDLSYISLKDMVRIGQMNKELGQVKAKNRQFGQKIGYNFCSRGQLRSIFQR